MSTRKSSVPCRDNMLEALGILSALVWLILYLVLAVLPSGEACRPKRLNTLTPLAVICTTLTATAFVVSFFAHPAQPTAYLRCDRLPAVVFYRHSLQRPVVRVVR